MAQKTTELEKARAELRKLESRVLVPPPAEGQAGETMSDHFDDKKINDKQLPKNLVSVYLEVQECVSR